MTLKITETMIKSAIKDFLALKGIFSWPVTAGMGSYKGAPDRIMHLNGQVVYEGPAVRLAGSISRAVQGRRNSLPCSPVRGRRAGHRRYLPDAFFGT
jgi:hypothetical protein